MNKRQLANINKHLHDVYDVVEATVKDYSNADYVRIDTIEYDFMFELEDGVYISVEGQYGYYNEKNEVSRSVDFHLDLSPRDFADNRVEGVIVGMLRANEINEDN